MPGSVVVVSLGFDTYGLDPIGDFALTTDVYHEVGRRVAATGRRLVILQEGGYHRPSLGENARAWLRGAEGRPFEPLPAAGFTAGGSVVGSTPADVSGHRGRSASWGARRGPRGRRRSATVAAALGPRARVRRRSCTSIARAAGVARVGAGGRSTGWPSRPTR